MRDVLALANRKVLEPFARAPGRTLLGLDFDGTLAPIVANRERAAMRPSTRQLLRRVARVYPTVVISGRARADVWRRVRGLGLAAVLGNHGIENRHTRARTRPVRRWIHALEERLARLSGVVIEDKGHSLAVHYRASRDKREAREIILAAATRLESVRLLGGSQVVNVLPAGATDKGRALESARRRLGCDKAIYVGDDDTDEDVFSLARPGRLLGIRVGRRRLSAATYAIRSQADIDGLLRVLLAMGPPATARRRRAGL
jgi:trehalose 6-phosphate phosphatase